MMLKWVNPACVAPLLPWVTFRTTPDAVCLTFDDGPHPAHTPAVLDVLSNYGAKGAFFLRGDRIAGQEAVVRRMAAEGHVIASHGWSHRRLAWRPALTIRHEIEATAQAIQAITGQKPTLFRPPYGRFDVRFQRILKETGHRLALWSLLAYDWAERDPAAVLHTVKRHLRPGAVLVFHDGHRQGAMLPEVLPEVIGYVRSMGLGFGEV